MNEPILAVRELDGWIEGQQVIDQLDFDVAPSGVTALLGRNGVGKTSTLKAVLGLIPGSGQVDLAGHALMGERTDQIIRRGIGYVPEDREVFATLTVAENLRLAMRDASQLDLVHQLFPELEQRRNQLAGTLSGGQQQMVSLARALMNDNRLLLIDEPTKGLAPKIVSDVTVALARAAERTPVLLVEQNLRVVADLAHTVIVLTDGHIVHTGPTDEFLGTALAHRHLGVGVTGGEVG